MGEQPSQIVALPLVCGNCENRENPCWSTGTKACSSCQLVVYCGHECQKPHWPLHRIYCRSPLSKENWRPRWDQEAREPPWATSEESKNWHNPFGGGKYLWGNTPAIDVIQLERNEGLEYQDDIALLFAASGDLRHVVKTISNLPLQMQQKITVTINDLDSEVVLRNVLLILLSLSNWNSFECDGKTSSTSTVVDAMIHLWYSAFIPEKVMSLVRTLVAPLLHEAHSQSIAVNGRVDLNKTNGLSNNCSFHATIPSTDWLTLQSMIHSPPAMSASEAAKVRQQVTLAPERSDFRDRWYYKEASPAMRVAKKRFQDDGVLLPFGHSRAEFNIPNPSLFRGPDWPMCDKADPSSGWQLGDIRGMKIPALADWYGKVYAHLQKVFQEFLQRVRTLCIDFHFFNVNAMELSQYIEMGKYARIEVSNICDRGYIGIKNTLSMYANYLQPVARNSFATIITLFINAVREVTSEKESAPNLDNFLHYIPPKQLLKIPWDIDADFYRIWDARYLTIDVEKLFDRYMEQSNFQNIARQAHLAMKTKNTIINEWPTRLRLSPGQEGAEQEFRYTLGSEFTSIERYVEWQRVGQRDC